jgi:hypothetical protein
MPQDWTAKNGTALPKMAGQLLAHDQPCRGQGLLPADNPGTAQKSAKKRTPTILKHRHVDAAAFRTAIRFRARAIADGYRHSNIVRSFESATASTFDTTTRTQSARTGSDSQRNSAL